MNKQKEDKTKTYDFKQKGLFFSGGKNEWYLGLPLTWERFKLLKALFHPS
jgi:hypothetical protein